MSQAAGRVVGAPAEGLPEELLELRARVLSQTTEVRDALGPLVEDVVEHARFRGRVLSVARDALEQFKLDLDLARFDLDATRREREELIRRLGGGDV